jgi:hypothetical protein
MISTLRSTVCIVAFILSIPAATWAIDTVELTTGAKATGTIRSYSGSAVVIDVKIGTRTFQRRYPKDRVKAIIHNGKRIDMRTGKATEPPAGGRAGASNGHVKKSSPRSTVRAKHSQTGTSQPS